MAHLRIQSYGTVDETNAVLGLVRLHTGRDAFEKLDQMLARIQNELFDLGADLCVRRQERIWATSPCGLRQHSTSGSKRRSTNSMP